MLLLIFVCANSPVSCTLKDFNECFPILRQRHPEAVPRRGRRMRPPSPETCTMPTVEPPISFKDVLVKFAKMSQNEPLGPRLPYPEVTLHPVPPPLGPASSLLQGILTKPGGNRSTNFSPTLARLLTAPERPSPPTAPIVAAPAVSISDLLGPSKVSSMVRPLICLLSTAFFGTAIWKITFDNF